MRLDNFKNWKKKNGISRETGHLVGLIGSLQSSEDVYERWLTIGLLDGLSEDVAKDMAMAFEISAQMRIASVEHANQSDIEGIIDSLIFPIMRRVLTELPSLAQSKETIVMVYNDAIKLIYNNKKFLKEDFSHIGIDSEAELCVIVSDELIRKYEDYETN